MTAKGKPPAQEPIDFATLRVRSDWTEQRYQELLTPAQDAAHAAQERLAWCEAQAEAITLQSAALLQAIADAWQGDTGELEAKYHALAARREAAPLLLETARKRQQRTNDAARNIKHHGDRVRSARIEEAKRAERLAERAAQEAERRERQQTDYLNSLPEDQRNRIINADAIAEDQQRQRDELEAKRAANRKTKAGRAAAAVEHVRKIINGTG